MKKRPSYTEKDVADGYIEKNDEDVKVNVFIKP